MKPPLLPAALAAMLGLVLPLAGAGQGFPLTATTWAVPASANASPGSGTYGFLDFSTNTDVANDRSWDVFDINGDSRPDIVVSGAGTGTRRDVVGGAANPHWEVYLSSGSGFATTATTWAVPPSQLAGAGAYGFYGLHNTTSGVGRRIWDVLDINGDHRPDIVATGVGTGSFYEVIGGVANPHWEIFLNTGTGFAPIATDWPVPPTANTGSGTYGFGTTSFNGIAQNRRSWSLFDVNGDTRPDIVVTSVGNGTSRDVLGGPAAPHWDVYLNTGTGFATTATTWVVPPSMNAGPNGFYLPAVTNTGISQRSWSTFDLNGDNRPDIVVTSEGDGTTRDVLGGAAAPHWEAYLNTGTGFVRTAMTWAVPPSAATGATNSYGFYDLNNSTTEANRRGWRTLDINGDARPDLVATSLGDGQYVNVIGAYNNPHWEVYLNTATGFDQTATSWAVPSNPNSYGFYDFYNTAITNYSRSWQVMDFNGDAKPDIVVTSIGNGTSRDVLGGAAAPHWDVYLNSGRPTATAPATAALAACEVFPTPTAGLLTLRTAPAYQGAPYQLLDGLGRVCAAGTVTAGAQVLDLQALPAGVYSLQLRTAAPRCLRVVKQ
ncbi:T9SS type A sorting domain-containing protein [Hymenobacter sp. ASUV-10]|uniref:T9SS type A sorting domain-containing protein n=1 Tax=Hymenobacter aranciens TaxID=3063996 RepID=A0ABT9BCR5_9BACT|nr:T9SS type A sorting domain-containing protein [Hymenobacter sp. ASUV-10]MDO7876033.1 T9SS type A sorting domain-containing protein [Hymenobacter sp. ASUV-10]